MRLLALFIPLLLALSLPSRGENVRIVTWNAKELFTSQDAGDRTGDLTDFVSTTAPGIVILQEVTPIDVVHTLNSVSGLNAPFVACSDFVQDPTKKHASFEVAILSKFPLDQVIEYDPSLDYESDDPDELHLQPLLKIGVEPIGTSRGYLWARIDPLNLNLFAVNLKSSNRKDLSLFPDVTCLVAGDFP